MVPPRFDGQGMAVLVAGTGWRCHADTASRDNGGTTGGAYFPDEQGKLGPQLPGPFSTGGGCRHRSIADSL